MVELTTPNKASNNSAYTCCTPLDRFALSPLIPRNSLFFCMSPLQPIQISYISPERSVTKSCMEELLGMCDCNPRIFKRSPKLPSINRSIKKIKKQDDDKIGRAHV